MSIKAFEIATSNTGCPYPDKDRPVELATDDVLAVGKLTICGDARVTFFLKLRDGRMVSVKVSDQPKEEQRFLYKLGRSVWAGNAPLGGWRMKWTEDRA